MSLIAVIAVDEGRSCFLRRTERMETEHLFRSAALLPVRLRLEGLHERLAHLDRTLAEVPTGLSDDIQRRLERAALFRGLNAIQRSYEAIGTVLCLILDGSTPDDEESWYGDALDQLSGTGSGRVPVVPRALADLLCVVGVYPDFDPVLELEPNLEIQRRRHAAALRAAPMLFDALTTLDARLINGTLRIGCAADPEFVAQHPGREERAEARARALQSAFGSIGIKVREVPQECSCFRSLWICGTTDQFGAFRDVSALIAS